MVPVRSSFVARVKLRATLVVVFTLSLGLSAFGGGAVASAKSAPLSYGPINIWYSNNAQEISWGEQEVAAWNHLYPSQKVTGQQIPAAESSEEVIEAAITAGSEPCLIYNTAPAAVPDFEAMGGLVPLNSFPGAVSYIYARTGALAGMYKSPDNQFYQMPWKSNPVVIFYNKTEFAKAGISTTNPPLATYSEFLATAKKLVSSGAAKLAIDPSPSSEFYEAWYDFYPLYAAESGGKLLVENGKATFDSSAGQAVAAFWAQLYKEKLAGNETYTGDPFADGTAAMAIVGPWAIADYQGKEGSPKVNYGVVPLPTSKGNTSYTVPTFSDAKNIAMYASCKNRGTAWDFLKFTTSESADGKLLSITGQMPIRQGLEKLYASYFTANPDYKDFAVEAAHIIDCPYVSNSIEVWQVFRNGWSKAVIFGSGSPDAALASASSAIDKLVASNSSP
jgi:multiple sugar transport system substrate-binding protein